MATQFQVAFRKSVGNLHLKPEGVFDGNSAWVLTKTIREQYNGFGRVFVSTAGLNEIRADGVKLFKSLMSSRIMPMDHLYFKGEKGFSMAPNGSRVIIPRKCGCGGRGSVRRFRPRIVK
ncbi:MAG: peptidylprolyl isomerase [Deltaproteobacteria bacterium]|nr:MAG: peptidylprolyl isomerase [Deltaproteobacteria bacterium]